MEARRTFERSIPLLFLLITVAAYGLLLPLTGFYWDDWPFAWIAEFLGPQEFIPAFAQVRPFLGPIFFVTTSLIPPVPLYWQIFALVIRFLAGLSAWFALRQVWPRHTRQTLIAALLLLVFPGYSQHWVAFTHINQEWIPFIFYLLSFGFSARALRNPAMFRSNTTYALLLLIAGVFPTEYFVSIEPLRFLFIWVIVSEHVIGWRQQVLESFKRWLPYLLVWLANAAWLAYFYTIGGYQSYEVEVVRQPLTLMQLVRDAGDAIWKAGVYIWVQVLLLASRAITAPTTLATIALIVMSFVLLFLYLQRHNSREETPRAFAGAAIVIGLAGILLGRIPSFAAGLPLTLQSSFDRFMISMMLGGTLFIVGWIEMILRGQRSKTVVFALLIAIGIGQQFFNANIFRRDWAKQQEIYWQLAWRIPDLKPNTALLTHQMPIDYETDLSFTAPINWMYAPQYAGGDLPYALLYTEKRLGGGSLPSLEPDTDITLPVRRVGFYGSTSQALVIYMPPNGCLRVLDPERGDINTYARQSRFLVDAIPLSDLSNIQVDGQPTVSLPFLSEPEHTWCYYFSQAELARQQEDWAQVVDLVDQARSLGYEPEDPFEWLTYIEAQARTGHVESAIEMSYDVLQQENRIRRGLCELWKRVELQESTETDHMHQILADLQCAN